MYIVLLDFTINYATPKSHTQKWAYVSVFDGVFEDGCSVDGILHVVVNQFVEH